MAMDEQAWCYKVEEASEGWTLEVYGGMIGEEVTEIYDGNDRVTGS